MPEEGQRWLGSEVALESPPRSFATERFARV
jgi:hypothetical protein